MSTADSKPANFFARGEKPLWQKAALFGAAYLICAEVGSYLSDRNGTYISFWLPAGLSIAVLLLNRTRDWPWLLLAVLPANYIFDFLHDQKPNPAVIFLFYVANVVQSATGAWLVRRFVTERPTLATLKEFFGLVGFAAVFGTMLGAVIGAATLVHFGLSQSFDQSWKNWWGSTMMAVLVFTPFILTWFSKSNGAHNCFDGPKKIAEAILVFLGLIAFVWYVLVLDKGAMSPNKSLAIPFLLWAGLRFGVRGATAASLFISLLLAFFTAQFFCGLTLSQISSGEYVFVMQVALAMASLVALIPAIVVRERERTLAELRESEERFKNLVAAAFEGICISENGRILDVNNQFLAMFGYEERAEMIGRQIIELVAPEWRDSIAERIRAGHETIYGHHLLRKDGSIFPAEAQAKIVRAGNRTLRMTALRDVTERRRAEEALVQSEERFALMFKNSPLPVALIRLADGIFLDVNESFLHMAGYTREETIGHTSLELRLYPDPGRRVFILDQLHQQGHLHGHEQQFREKSGKIRSHVLWFEVIPISGEKCILVTALDITERKRAELERAEALAREQQARVEYTFRLIAAQEAERTRIAAELHDSLGQNLLLIKNRAQLALGKENQHADLREQTQAISDLASQAIAEVRQISHDLHPPQLDHLGLTRALEAMIDDTAQASDIAFGHKLDFVDDLFPKDAAMNLYRIVQESLNNILKHSRAKKAKIKLERDVHEVQLNISDDGCGFNASGSGDNPKSLGLKNIAERVNMLGGKFKIDSAPGKGTRVEITVPFSESE